MLASNLSNFGAPPPAPSGWGRLQPYLRTAVTGGALVTLFLFGAQLVLPEGWRPADIAGDAAGSAERHEAQAKMEAKVEIERRVADGVAQVQAQAQAKAQADVLAVTTAVEERNKGLAGMSTWAAIADAACIGSRIVAANTQPSLGADWRRPQNNGWHDNAQAVANSTCGLGGFLREEVTRSQLDAVRTASAARGMSMNNGAGSTIPARAVPPTPAPAAPVPVQAVAAPRTLDEVYAMSRPTQLYSSDEVMKARAYVAKLPKPVQARLLAGLTTNGQEAGWDLLVERTRAYAVLVAFN